MGGSNRERGAGRREKARVIMREQDVLRYGEEAKDRSGGCMESWRWLCVSMEEQPSGLAPLLLFYVWVFFCIILSMSACVAPSPGSAEHPCSSRASTPEFNSLDY